MLALLWLGIHRVGGMKGRIKAVGKGREPIYGRTGV